MSMTTTTTPKETEAIIPENCISFSDHALECTFSTRKVITIGTGTTTQKKVCKLFWLVRQVSDNQYQVHKLNDHFVPVGDPITIDNEILIRKYFPEVKFNETRVQPAIRELNKTIARGDRHRRKGELFTAEMDYGKGLEVDEKNIRCIFGIGLIQLSRGNIKRATKTFCEIVKLNSAFKEEHKHLFNEFGISLRRNNMFDEAAEYYSRALEFSSNDENLYFNLARAHYERKDLHRCLDSLKTCLDLNCFMSEAADFVQHLEKILIGKPEFKDQIRQLTSRLSPFDEDEVDTEPISRRPAAQKTLHYNMDGEIDIVNF